ncbi:MAG: HEAT repeat domain-containing protein [Gemmatimonadaceae bacterium]
MNEGLEHAMAFSRLLAVSAASASAPSQRDRPVRAVEEYSRTRALRLEQREGMLLVDGHPVSMDHADMEALVVCMLSHQVRRLRLRQFITAREIRNIAWLLSRPAVDPQHGAAIERTAAELRAWNVDLVGESHPDVSDDAAELQAQLVQALQETSDTDAVRAALRQLAEKCERALQENDAAVVGAALVALHEAEQNISDDAQRGEYAATFQRLCTPMAVKLTAQVLPTAKRRDAYAAVLAKAGDVGIEALFAHLVAAEEMHARRIFFDALVDLRGGIPILLQALRHEQWYLVRNAAELLGEMGASEACDILVAHLQSPDDKLRAAAASALARIGTTEALEALKAVVRDSSARVRYFANTVLFADLSGSNARQLATALEEEEDGEVQLQIVAALGRLGTPDAVQKLIQALAPGRTTRAGEGFGSDLRCAAIEAVAHARGSAALTVIRALTQDRDLRVRDVVRRMALRLA